jgi:hypothetical protein
MALLLAVLCAAAPLALAQAQVVLPRAEVQEVHVGIQPLIGGQLPVTVHPFSGDAAVTVSLDPPEWTPQAILGLLAQADIPAAEVSVVAAPSGGENWLITFTAEAGDVPILQFFNGWVGVGWGWAWGVGGWGWGRACAFGGGDPQRGQHPSTPGPFLAGGAALFFGRV